MIHQWTGNLISCGWWDDLWINEAFADFGGYLSLRWAEPDVVWENQARSSQIYDILYICYNDILKMISKALKSILLAPVCTKSRCIDPVQAVNKQAKQ